MLAFLGLFTVSLISIYRRIIDPSLGGPKWPDRLKKPGDNFMENFKQYYPVNSLRLKIFH
jgi:hypothetical protein